MLLSHAIKLMQPPFPPQTLHFILQKQKRHIKSCLVSHAGSLKTTYIVTLTANQVDAT